MAKHRLYIDESGTHGYSDKNTVKQRYLALAGIFISEQQVIEVLQPGISAMKRLVAEDPDSLPVLHRTEIVNKSGAFAKLNNPNIERQFNDIFLNLLTDMDYCLCSVVLDKKSHLQRYESSALHPYHYCLNMLLERYTFHLEAHRGKGDVLAEARMKNEDRALAAEYTRFYEHGTYYRKPSVIQKLLTTREIKLKTKTKMISGLEFADLLALAMKLDTLVSHAAIPQLTSNNFNKVIIEKIQPKYYCLPGGSANGFGKKLVE